MALAEPKTKPEVLSLETRARIIADASTSLPIQTRAERVFAVALEQLRHAVAIGSLSNLAHREPPNELENFYDR